MSIGSAFDSYVKNYIFTSLFGKGHDEYPTYELDTLFASAVESHNRDWARIHGMHAFTVYKESGALQSLMYEMENAINEPRMEFSIESTILEPALSPMGINLLGKPDLYFINKDGNIVIYDWKVNGYCAKQSKSPAQGYLKLFHEDGTVKKPHKKCIPKELNGLVINGNGSFDEYDEKWAVQLGVYSWLTGAHVGQPIVVGIDQLVCKPNGLYPTIRVAAHRSSLSKNFQLKTFLRALKMKQACETGHIFTEETREESDRICRNLDLVCKDRFENPDDDFYEACS